MEIWGGAEDLRVRNLKAVAESMGTNEIFQRENMERKEQRTELLRTRQRNLRWHNQEDQNNRKRRQSSNMDVKAEKISRTQEQAIVSQKN